MHESMPLFVLTAYFGILFVVVMAWSKLRHRNRRSRRDAERPLLRKIEEEEREHSAASRAR